MIVSVCADTSAPGVTDLTLALALVWPGQRLVLEADVSGADLAFRTSHADGLLDAQPSVLTLAADARGELAPGAFPSYAQPTVLGVPVIPGAPTAEAFAPMARLWPQVATAAAAWNGTVLADLGQLLPGDPARPIAAASEVVILLTRADVAGLFRLRERARELSAAFGGGRDVNPVVVAVRARPGAEGRRAVAAAQQVLDAAGIPVPVLGLFADDPAGRTQLHELRSPRRLLGSDLVRSTRALVAALHADRPAAIVSPTLAEATS